MKGKRRNSLSTIFMTNQGGPDLGTISVSDDDLVALSYEVRHLSHCGLDVAVLFLEGPVLSPLEDGVSTKSHYGEGFSLGFRQEGDLVSFFGSDLAWVLVFDVPLIGSQRDPGKTRKG